MKKEDAPKRGDTNQRHAVQKLKTLKQWCEDSALGIPNEKDGEWSVHPWFAPRVLMQYWEWQTQGERFTPWSMDSYDGSAVWVDMEILPDENYRGDVEPTTAQGNELRPKLMQLENETEELMEKDVDRKQKQEEWKHIRRRQDRCSTKCTAERNTPAGP